MSEFIMAIVMFFSSLFGSFVTFFERLPENQYNADIVFESITAEETKISEKEKQLCREWFDNNILLKGDVRNLPYDFNVADKALNKNIDDWDISVGGESQTGAVYKDGKTTYVYLTHKSSGLKATVEATIYEDFATCEWTVYIENTAQENSPVVSSFYAVNTALNIENAQAYYSKGSYDEPYDFALMQKSLSIIPKTFTSYDGRPTDKYLPYFNISGENGGVVFGVGWSGLWQADIAASGKSVSIKAKQESFKAYLEPGESVRSPLVSLSFYDGDNPLKGFNTFRSWISGCVYPENIPDTLTMLEFSGPAHTQTAAELMAAADGFGEKTYAPVDYFWMDAGWYKYNEGWHDGVGSWVANPNRFPNGIIEVSEYAASKGCGLVLWFEPERVRRDTLFCKKGAENENWLISVKDEDNYMFNLAEDGATDYLIEYISDFLIENKISVYRQDFNFSPDVYWAQADKEYYGGRTGITENHYVTNLYRYLDSLCENVDGLIIDNCASGGRRLDLEMARRSVPVWRSDYNCNPHEDILEATQAQTYGLSFWLPLSGTVVYSGSEYASRTSIIPLCVETFGTVHSPHYGEYITQREMMNEYYYPLSAGGYFSDRMLAMQYSDYSASSGMALVYKRADVTDSEYTVRLNGLEENTVYSVYDYDKPETVLQKTGAELMTDGITLTLPEGEKAFIIMFNSQSA
ncbi:MAG: alpha-galactosidase [Clostridia bacterium]|nr:alpha-galactosidase [Clostridia bacterium]